MRVLVTGGAGYIGGVVAALLLESGHEVTVLDDLSTGHRDAVPDGARFVEASIFDADSVLQTLGPLDGVLHFAAKSLVGESMTDPHLYWDNNVRGSLALLEAVRAHRIGRFVFSSTAATYGEPEQVPIPETAPTRPLNPYGASKLAVDTMLDGYCAAYGLAAVSLRYFNVAGALLSERWRQGERHRTETHLIPIALQVAAGTRDALHVYGRDYPTEDGSCVRDYIHVVDLAQAHLLALDAARPGSHDVVNLGNGRGNSVLEVLETVRAVTGHPIPAQEHDRRPGDPAVLIASNSRAREFLDWTPSRPLADMVSDAWKFARP